MKYKATTTICALGLMLVVGVVALAFVLSTGAASVSASTLRTRDLHVTKECSQWTGEAGSYCTITSSNLARLNVGSRVYYDQAFGIPQGLLDSNVVLDTDNGRAVGRCTLDSTTGQGLCTFSDGTGRFAGFNARVNVSFIGGFDWSWEGTYSFAPRD
jgi:hypothetical protein